jgi:hypothetical protein
MTTVNWAQLELLAYLAHMERKRGEHSVVYYRTIRSDRVKILHKIYIPSSAFMQYDGRLDGMRYVFWNTDKGMNMPMSELAWRMLLTPYGDLFMFGPEKVDGEFPWRNWYLER